MAVEFERVMALFGQALPTETDRAAFEGHMNEANARGLNWIQGLEYAAAQRGTRRAAGTAVPAQRRPQWLAMAS